MLSRSWSQVRSCARFCFGPLFFIIFLNDISDGLSPPVQLFADDWVLSRIIRTLSDCVSLQDDLDKLFDWGDAWKMVIHFEKAVVMSFTRKQITHEVD